MEKLTKSPRLNYLLGSIDIFSPYDVLKHLPRKYEDYSYSDFDSVTDKQRITILGQVIEEVTSTNNGKLTICSFAIKEKNTGKYLKIIAFNRPYLTNTIKMNNLISLTGIFDAKRNVLNMINFSLGEIEENHHLKAIYTLPSGITNYQFSSLVKRSLNELKGKIYSPIPYRLINKYKLINKETAYNYIHFPINDNQIKQALRYLKYEEALMFSLKNLLIRKENKSFTKIKKEPIGFELCDDLIKKLPYQLTDDQKIACKEIIDDMNQSTLMYRLLQGDVGSGKTLVCFMALYANYKRGDQGVLLAPTDALAKQHYENAKKIFQDTNIRIALLVGEMPLKDKKDLYSDIEDGSIDIIIGTHAVFSKSVNYSSLGLAIIDEQHRFGVNQRLALSNKGNHSDLLMLSATPIPRSLALSLYGDLEISTLTSFPNKKRNVKTLVLSDDSPRLFKCVDYALEQKRQVYIIGPKINMSEEDDCNNVEQLFKVYFEKYGEIVGLLHGKMTAKDKDRVLSDFYSGRISILVSTQVIEVGIDIKNASTIIIYNANEFGLASIHQLRGRIGRDGGEAFCILTHSNKTEQKLERLDFLKNHNDGFLIAEYDLKLRGPGELTGQKQSGLPEFKFLNVYEDLKIFQIAKKDAQEILSNASLKENKYIIEKAEKDIIYHPVVNA